MLKLVAHRPTDMFYAVFCYSENSKQYSCYEFYLLNTLPKELEQFWTFWTYILTIYVKYDKQNICIANEYFVCHMCYAIVLLAFISLKKEYRQYKTHSIHLTQRNMSIQLVAHRFV